MHSSCDRILVLALGNDILGDDGVGFAVARALRTVVNHSSIDIVESGEAGLALLEILEGYDRALLLDSVMTGLHPPGTICEFSPGDFRQVNAPSPHYAGLPEVLAMAKRLELTFPRDIRILALEVENPFDLCEAFTPNVENALPDFAEKAWRILEDWTSGKSSPMPPSPFRHYPFVHPGKEAPRCMNIR